jgi:hypothetical protein
MQAPQPIIGTVPVVCYTQIDARHRHTGATRHLVGGAEQGAAAALAVCRDGDSFYLFYCDADWEPVTDTWHESLGDALDQAEVEYAGTRETWVHVGAG